MGAGLDIESLRSFLEVATHGSFTTAAARLNLAQSSVSARIKVLEQQLGHALFIRDKDGTRLTAAGQQFLHHASTITRTWEQARLDIAVPEGFEALLRLTAPVNLWDRIIASWVPWMREHQPKVALRLEGSFPDTVMDQLIEGLLDICILYYPRPHAGIAIETLADEPVVLVQHKGARGPWMKNYILVDWGPEFRAEHDRVFPGATRSAISTGLVAVGLRYILEHRAAGYLPLSAAAKPIADGTLKRVKNAPVFHRQVYLVYPSDPQRSSALEVALSGLRTLAKDWAAKA